MARQHRTLSATLVGALLAAGSCSSVSDEATGEVQGEWTSDRQQDGDTLMVRTLAGSIWGDTASLVEELAIGQLDGEQQYLFGRIAGLAVALDGSVVAVDAQAAEVRIFSADGQHVRTFGREGGGPGEFRRPDLVEVTSDGRIVVRDPVAARFSLFSLQGEYLTSWSYASGYSTNAPFYVSDNDRVVNPSLRDHLVVYDLTGAARDTLQVPSRGFTPPRLDVVMENGRASYEIPFQPREHWSVTREGSILFGNSQRLSFERWTPTGQVLKVERLAAPVPVVPGEAAQDRESLARAVRRAHDPTWTWQGASIPATKPYYRSLLAGIDGTVWLFREGPSTEEPNPNWEPDRADVLFATMWTAPIVADVFDAQGTYLGPVRLPTNVTYSNPHPVLSRERIWAVGRHALGYPQVLVLKVVPS